MCRTVFIHSLVRNSTIRIVFSCRDGVGGKLFHVRDYGESCDLRGLVMDTSENVTE